MDIYEVYYINKLKPKYNSALVYEYAASFNIDELVFNKYDLIGFNSFYTKPKKINNENEINLTYVERKKIKLDKMLENSIKIIENEKINIMDINPDKIKFHWDRGENIRFLTIDNTKYGINTMKIFHTLIKENKMIKYDGRYELKINGRFELPDVRFSIEIERCNSTEWINIIQSTEYSTKENISTIYLSKNCYEICFLKYFK